MPELPDVVVYVEHLQRRLIGARLERVRVRSLNLLRTADPPLEACDGRAVTGVTRLGKRIVLALEREWFLAIHLMISGRFRWRDAAATPVAIPGKVGLAAFDFDRGTLLLTEASSHQRAALHVLAGTPELRALDPGGLEPLEASREEFALRLRLEDHTLKRALTDPRLFSGIGNSYSDEILHRARLSPLRRTARLDDATIETLWNATREVLTEWTERLRSQSGDRFPEKVTAFRPEMAVHGRFKLPCPVCGAPVQRIVYAEHETNYCARCQTGGRLLADRALSRLLKRDWPRSLEELEESRRPD
ncbi:MAG: formamidopyrimidine-DNA glycosylase [Candidatus Eisenbacteria bacterium]|uniref:Formamidopyrimidine-DNA glycosylase n=1 Tax=Eiseniibacteriota bacterium TaxID=2212470 RepID=A0A849SKY5_UNCEI|nr:formamidopyrimidine-DNA glycosylase [Candidatus Eisenbacteria bacterium]